MSTKWSPAAVIEELVQDISDDARAAAAHLLREASDLPQRLATEFSRRWSNLGRTIDLPAPTTGYFSVISANFEDLLARGQLAVPGSVFGSSAGNWSAVTCLLANGQSQGATAP